MYQVGSSKVDMTGFVYNKGMMGYAVHFHVVKGIKTPIYTRAFAIKDKATGQKVILVNAEICFYSIAVKDAVIKKLEAEHPALGYNDRNVMLTAQHTHSAPGGHSHYVAYNLSIPGFQPHVFNKYVEATIQVILEADAKLQDAQIFYDTGDFSPDEDVAFNRSLAAYNNNPEIKKKVLKKDHHLAIDRTMKLMRFETMDGVPIGTWNWFGVHTTSVNNDKTNICSDNKGYAATNMETFIRKEFQNEDYISVFAQDTAGDVSPNYQWNNQNGFSKGKFEDDYKSAQYTGKLQSDKALEIFYTAKKSTPISGGIHYELMYVDMADVEVDPEFCGGKRNVRTGPSDTGSALLQGASDRPAVPALGNFFLGVGSRTASTVVKTYEKTLFKLFANKKVNKDNDLKYANHYPKHIILEPTMGKVLGTTKLKDLVLPGTVDPTIKALKTIGKNGLCRRTPWMPNILPLQIVRIGPIAILGIAAEVTTIAGKRLRESVLKILKHQGVQQVIIGAYTNGFSGYITTPEEYDKQMYEGGHTIFGRNTLPAYQTGFKKLALSLRNAPEDRQIDRSVQPDIFAEDEIWYGEDF